MKKIIVKYFSCKNLGDDLFVAELARAFPGYSFLLLGNPLLYTKEFGPNVHFHIYSYVYIVIGKICAVLHNQGHLYKFLKKINEKAVNYIENSAVASVYIGGSLFMSEKPSVTAKEIDFSVRMKPDYNIRSSLNLTKPRFVIGANLGPCYSEQYWKDLKCVFNNYMHVSLRDYSSFYKCKDLLNTQYAPDVVFNVSVPVVKKEKSIVISVVLAENYVDNSESVTAYYKQLACIADYYIELGFEVTAVSFCKKLGDEKAIDRLKSYSKNSSSVKEFNYNGNIQECLFLFASSEFVVGTRFHSIIIALNFGKPVLPIVYNCKTKNYLSDIDFEGKVVDIKDMKHENIQSLLCNFSENYIVDCEKQKKYAKNQFWGLRQYLESLDE